jgi:subtilisin family serine protease
VSYSSKLKRISSIGAVKKKEFSATGFIHIKSNENKTTQDLISYFKSNKDIETVQPNYQYHAVSTTPSELNSGNQWSLSNTGQTITNPDCSVYAINNPGKSGCDINIKDAWDYISECSSVTVAVIDSGVNYNHDDLKNNMWSDSSGYHGYDFVNSSSPYTPLDYYGHGTMIAGIIASSSNDSGTLGVFWKAKIMAIRVLDSTGIGTSSNIVQGINYAVSNGAKIICLCIIGGNSFDPAIYSALSNAKSSGVLVITGAGNDGVDINQSATTAHPEYDSFPAEYATNSFAPEYPALDNIINVTAIDQSFSLASFSNYGNSAVDIAAPGVNIYNTWAGTVQTINDDFMNDDFSSVDWNGREDNTSFTKTNWGVQSSGSTYILSNPCSAGYYRLNSKDRAFKTYYFGTGATITTLSCKISYSFYDLNDSIGLYITNTDNYYNPQIDSASVSLFSSSDISNTIELHKDISTYCKDFDFFSLIFYFTSNNSGNNTTGTKISNLTLNSLTLNSTSYYPRHGTSLAAAHVAGVAAMLLGFNSDYSYYDIISALKNGSTKNDSLTSSIKNGNMLNATGSFYYVSTPEDITIQEQ